MRGRVHASGDRLLDVKDVVVRRVPFDKEFGGKGFAAHVLNAPLVGDVPSLAGPGGQIHPDNTLPGKPSKRHGWVMVRG